MSQASSLSLIDEESARTASTAAVRLPPWCPALAVSGLAWCVLFLSIPPAAQNFPLADDWAYARGVFGFAEGKGIHYPQWSSMPQLGQWLWAWPWVKLLGAHHWVLRLSTIVLSWVGLWAFADLLRQEGFASRWVALLTAALALDPLFLLLQGTYMTDVPALSFSLLALAFYGRALTSAWAGWLVPAAIVTLLAIITRQNTVTVVLAAGMLLARAPALRKRPRWWAALLGPLLVAVATHLWFQSRTDIIPAGAEVPQPDEVMFLPYFAVSLGGLAALPVLLASPGVALRKRFLLLLLIVTAAAGYWWVFGPQYLMYGRFVPYTDAILTPFGAYSGALVPGRRPLLLGLRSRCCLTVLGCLAGALLVTRVLERREKGIGLLLWFTIWQLPFLMIAPEVWDRYLLVLFPGLMLAVVPQRDARPRWLAAWLTVGVYGAIAVALMHDWLSWNRARWELGRAALERDHLKAADIEGGFEWDGWYAPADRPQIRSLGEFFQHSVRPAQQKGLTLPTTQNWFPHVTGRYALSFTPLEGTRILDGREYSQWLLPGKRVFYLLEQVPQPTTTASSRNTP